MQLIDQYLRKVNYLRVSVTDRCDLRCVYCMKEKMQFLPRKDILTLEEIERLCDNFIELGVEKIRLTGGEPLVRNDIIKLIEKLNTKKEITNLVKSQNLIDIRTPSFINIKFFMDKKNNLVELDKRIKKIDLIENLYFLEINRKYVLIKIKYLGKINKIIDQLKSQNILLELKNDQWSIKII